MAGKPFFQLLKPDMVVPGTVLQLSSETLHHRGIRGIIFDVDDTLVPLRRPQPSPEVIAWLAQIMPEFQIWLVSNNVSSTRIAQIADALGAPHIHRAGKPSRRALRRAVAQMQLPLDQVALVGDRILTDVLAGNRLGVLTILVAPLKIRS